MAIVGDQEPWGTSRSLGMQLAHHNVTLYSLQQIGLFEGEKNNYNNKINKKTGTRRF